MSMNGRIFLIYLICLSFKKIDVVSGMDFLSPNSVYIGCKENAIFILTDEATLEDVVTTLLEGKINMENCLLEQEKVFILILTVDSSEKMNVLQIPVIYDFLKVFPEDVTSLAPKSKVEFSIDLVPRMTLIFVALYHMSSIKLRELKSQLEDLLR